MQDYELDAWIGPSADEATDEQRDAITMAARRIEARWPEPDKDDLRDSALGAAVQVILGENTLERIAGEWSALRVRERDAHAALTGALIAADDSEVSLSHRAGVTRTTVRKALGKDTPARRWDAGGAE